jgi:hypothetical protein
MEGAYPRCGGTHCFHPQGINYSEIFVTQKTKILMFTAVVTSNLILYKGHRPQSLSCKGQIVSVGDRGAGDNEWYDSCYSPAEFCVEHRYLFTFLFKKFLTNCVHQFLHGLYQIRSHDVLCNYSTTEMASALRTNQNKQTNSMVWVREFAASRRSDCKLLRIDGATWAAWRIPTVVFSVF